MPEVSRFFGILIKIFYDDHNPPHFHAEYEENTALIEMRNRPARSSACSRSMDLWTRASIDSTENRVRNLRTSRRPENREPLKAAVLLPSATQSGQPI